MPTGIVRKTAVEYYYVFLVYVFKITQLSITLNYKSSDT